MAHAELLQLKDQVAIVTGGGAGIGRAIALAYAKAGADVVIADSIPERCEEAAARVRELGRRALAAPTDVTDIAQIQATIAAADKEFGRIDILVNNAGGVAPKPFLQQSERSWRRLIDLNFFSVIAASQAAAQIMVRDKRGGVILNVASIEGSRAAPNFAVYAGCKAAMLNFTRSLALELSEHNIRVNAIAPDLTDTPGIRGNISGPVDPSKWRPFTDEFKENMARRIPLGRPGIDEECANAALYLSSAMSSYVTGVCLPVDGGTWASAGWTRRRDGSWTLGD